MSSGHWSWSNFWGEYRGLMLWLQIGTILLLIAIVVEVYR